MNNKRTTPISAMTHPNRHGFLRDTEPRPLTEDERVELEYLEMEKERNDCLKETACRADRHDEFLRRLTAYKKLPH